MIDDRLTVVFTVPDTAQLYAQPAFLVTFAVTGLLTVEIAMTVDESGEDMAQQTFDKGTQVRCTATFYFNGVETDPGGVVCKVKNPLTNLVTTYVYGTHSELARLDTGVYYVDVVGDSPGSWYLRFEGSGLAQGALEEYFKIRQSNFS